VNLKLISAIAFTKNEPTQFALCQDADTGTIYLCHSSHSSDPGAWNWSPTKEAGENELSAFRYLGRRLAKNTRSRETFCDECGALLQGGATVHLPACIWIDIIRAARGERTPEGGTGNAS
jgi:hypothetical protein